VVVNTTFSISATRSSLSLTPGAIIAEAGFGSLASAWDNNAVIKRMQVHKVVPWTVLLPRITCVEMLGDSALDLVDGDRLPGLLLENVAQKVLEGKNFSCDCPGIAGVF